MLITSIFGGAIFFSILCYSNAAMASSGKTAGRSTPVVAEIAAAGLWTAFYYLTVVAT